MDIHHTFLHTMLALLDRIRTINFLQNILNLCPARDSPEFQTIIRPNGTIIELSIDIWGVGDLVSSCNVVGIPQELLSFNLDLCKSDPD
ncbi:24596_t:CDS:2, partial [Entrophospora sp. SA101]